MSLEISSVADKGSMEKERLVLRVTADADVGQYAVLQTGWLSEKKIPTTRVYHTFWFPYEKVKAGDLVVVYTKEGTTSTKSTDDGHTAHFFYWGIKEPIWQVAPRGAVLLYAPRWESKGEL